jgi:hypothetical protein
MRSKLGLLSLLFCAILLSAPAVYARAEEEWSGPDNNTRSGSRKGLLHNLEVARNYFKLKKAYVAALMRLKK